MFSKRSSNPFFSENKFLKTASVIDGDQVMTAKSTMNKFGFLLFLLIASSLLTWKMFAEGADIKGWLIGGAIVGFILAMVVSFNPKTAPYIAPLYALTEGLFIGGISSIFNFTYKGINSNIIAQAVFLTIAVVVAMFVLYRFNIIKVTDRLRSIIISAVIGVAVFYLLGMVLSWLGVGQSLFYSNGLVGIAISGVIIVIAAMSLLLDFDMIEKGSAQGLPKYMEWYAAFGLLVTIIWIYMEVLRLIARLSGSNKN